MFELIFYLTLALFISFLCSVLEAVLLSTPISFISVKQKEGIKWADRFAHHKKEIDRPISAILTMNTIAHTVGAAGVGAQAVELFGETYFGVISAVLTLLILVFSEIIPKTIGARYWKNLSGFAVSTIQVFIYITYPFVWMSEKLTQFLSNDAKEPTVNRDEVSILAQIGAEEGTFEVEESRIIQNVLRLRQIRVTEVMTPRVVMNIADETMSLEDFLKNKSFLYYSRIPIYHEHPEKITGYVFRETVFETLAEKHENRQLKDIKRELLVLHESVRLSRAWELMLERKEHIALIVDEYGGVEGLITMEDIIETLLGLEILDEKDTIADLQAFAKDRWKKRKLKYDFMQ